ncbi:ROK family transcriptional regulator [Pantoea allii]|uniref:ROK family transcriptional regulator n=1 Tax=Pantoea allii TaxID=574096 RepID=UPI003D31E996
MTSSKHWEGIGTTQSAVLRYLRRNDSASRAEIADCCGVTAAAVSMMTRDLIKRGIVVEGARRPSGRGAPHIDLTLNSAIGYAIGIHASRFSITLMLLDFKGKLVDEIELIGLYETFAEARSAMQEGHKTLLERNHIPHRLLIGAGIAMPTRFQRGIAPLHLAPEVTSWDEPGLYESIRQALGCPVLIENDANAAAMGEMALGNAANHQDFVYLYLSEGIGSGIILGKQRYRGHLGNAGEIGLLLPLERPRPSFTDLAAWCKNHLGQIPDGRSQAVWHRFLSENVSVLDGWIERTGPEIARLGFMLNAVLAPAAIYLGGTLPQVVLQRLAVWLDFSALDTLNGTHVVQPEICLPDISATDTVAFGAAAMVLHNVAQPDAGES